MTFSPKTSSVPTIVLNDGHAIPQLGFGVWQVPDDGAYDAVAEALKVGYRSIDTAKVYENEAGTGKAIAESGIARDELFVTTKLWNDDQGYDSTLTAFDASMDRLGLDYLDLYLIHWQQLDRDKYIDTFKAFQKLKADGRIGSIGVSNFTIPTLEKLIDAVGEVPAVNQIELHPRFNQEELRAFHTSKGIATEAWSPLGSGTILDDPAFATIADAHGVTPAQVILRWHIQLGNVVIPKSVTPARIASNFDVFGFELSSDEIQQINALDTPDGRTGPDPDVFAA
ncbi:aldo/keto reductase [Rhodococcus sp. BP-252]|uniref:Oxidoreductase n=1 Tax=Rhodococcoides kyotonense TaxID=398843 RepID=A0A177YFX8_9NOCA|nr:MULTISPECIES: aldo/keto reductase [Rhodococcus]MBY6413085.1 aldo/keto reductase [Rhodococcus sp. BP-320]MBY6417752.1 aldo/keto reductase [Rhodococcus sp. BP-321]MBY6423902.1 aldo/keto reductase [Rhodococcus sp. BP-324]MBY6427827.1 aldo/keto reductase [Rhodococcus sp. BP-323]MBY6431826.1 aldo/keto reductase [Rhodococcus sp. BP-322]